MPVIKKGGKRPWDCCFALHPRHIHYLIPQSYAEATAAHVREFDLCISELQGQIFHA